jgi:hypothetical protein
VHLGGGGAAALQLRTVIAGIDDRVGTELAGMGDHLISGLTTGLLAHLGIGTDPAAHDRLEASEQSLHQGGRRTTIPRTIPLYARIA